MKQDRRRCRGVILSSSAIASLALLSCPTTASAAPTLQQQVATCKTGMNITTTLPGGDCFGPNTFPAGDFPTNPPTTGPLIDRVGTVSVNEQVDMVFRCRNVNYTNKTVMGDVRTSLEIILHNRQTGGTCFFSSQGPGGNNAFTTAGTFPSMDASAAVNYPLSKDQACTNCHDMGGPYIIADAAAAKTMGLLGILNNGHDTMNTRYNILDADPASQVTQNGQVSGMGPRTDFGCGSFSCHNTGRLVGFDIDADVNIVRNLLSPVMPPNFDESSYYRWINLDTPTNSTPSSGVEAENFASAMSTTVTAVPNVALATGLCSGPAVPASMEAHVIGLDDQFSFSTDQMALLPDRVRTFNLKDGLACINADQEFSQQCHDYGVRYLCSVTNTGTGSTPTWSGWYFTDSPSGDGDHEERSRDSNICGGATPIAIQAQVTVNGTTLFIMGPNDCLARFSPFGLTCNNADQPDGKCSNYVVRYHGCNQVGNPFTAILTGSFSAIELTASSSTNGAPAKGQPNNPAWNTQHWMVTTVPNTEYVWIGNTGTNTYLNVTSTAESAVVVTSTLNTSSTGEQWIMEGVSQSDVVRFKNLFSGKYLTIGDTSNFAPIYSQSLNTSLARQRWVVN